MKYQEKAALERGLRLLRLARNNSDVEKAKSIIDEVSRETEVPKPAILGRSRRRRLVRARWMAIARIRLETDLSLPEIGDLMGGRDHTTILHALRKVGEL